MQESILADPVQEETEDLQASSRPEFISPDYTYSLAELRAQLSLDREEILDLLDLKPSERDTIRSMLAQDNPADVINEMIFFECVGARLERMGSYDTIFSFRRTELDRAKLYRAEVTANGTQTSLNIFPFEIRQISSQHIPNRHTVGSNSVVLGMKIPDEDWKEVLKNIRPGPPPMVQDSFGFIRFIRGYGDQKDILCIVEFRNDMYERLTCPKLKEKYRDWAQLLLHTFEGVVQASHGLIPNPESESGTAEILFPPLTKVKERWKSSKTPIIDDYVVQHMMTMNEHGRLSYLMPKWQEKYHHETFRETPLKLGYETNRVFKKGSVLLRESGAKELRFRAGLMKTLPLCPADAESHLQSVDSGPLKLTFTGYPRVEKWEAVKTRFFPRDLFNQLGRDGYALHHPRDRRYILDGRDTTDLVSESFETVPTYPIPIDEVHGMTSHYISLQQKNWESGIGKLFQDLLPSHFTPISRGIDHGSFRDWWDIPQHNSDGWKVMPIHLRTQNRHPSIRLVRYENGKPVEMAAACIKGGGLGHIDGFKVFTSEDWSDELRLPIYRRIKTEADTEDVDNCLRHWGGMGRSEAESSWVHLLAIHDLVGSTDPELLNLLPIPLDAHKILSLPTWEGQQTEWYGLQEYAEKYLDEPSGIENVLSTLHTVSQCDVRIVRVIEKIFSPPLNDPSDRTERAQSVKQALSFFYFANGFEVDLEGISWPSDPDLNPIAQTLHYLKDVYERNSVAGEMLYRNVLENSLKVIGIVHGARGDLGGGGDKGYGARWGGAVAMRNFDARGGFHDMDSCCFFPWIPEGFRTPSSTFGNNSLRDYKQSLDLLYWRETLYWFDMIVHGSSDKNVSGSIRIKASPTDEMNSLRSQDPRSKLFQRLCHKFRKEHYHQETYLPEEDLLQIYRKYLERGKGFSSDF